jgi:hypothetical protein
MNTRLARSLLSLVSVSFLSACSVAKLEARLEANPQCKDVLNPKTGALMPCPGSDKAFYREAGLVPPKPSTTPNTQAASAPATMSAASSDQGPSGAVTTSAASSTKSAPTPVDCKPQIHKKTGGILPCPAAD